MQSMDLDFAKKQLISDVLCNIKFKHTFTNAHHDKTSHHMLLDTITAKQVAGYCMITKSRQSFEIFNIHNAIDADTEKSIFSIDDFLRAKTPIADPLPTNNLTQTPVQQPEKVTRINITYKGATGEISQRVVDVMSINAMKIKAFCHYRHAVREFYIDGIQKMVIVETGEVIQNPIAFFENWYINSPDGILDKVINQNIHMILILLYFARLDSRIIKVEMAELINFVQSCLSQKDKININRDLIADRVKRLSPQKWTDFQFNVRQLSQIQSIEVLQAYKILVEKMANADKKFTEDKKTALDFLKFRWQLS